MLLSPNFSYDSVAQASIGGVCIGLLAVCRLAGTKDLLYSSTYTRFQTPAMLLSGYALSRSYPAFFELPQSSSVPVESLLRISAAGMLVGAGARLGKGCTSGNGIQGISALSPASLVHVLIFMAAGAGTATLSAPGDFVGGGDGSAAPQLGEYSTLAAASALSALLQIPLAGGSLAPLADMLSGFSFASALTVSSMVKPSKVATFLDFTSAAGWDPSLAFVMGGALLFALPAFAALSALGKGIRASTDLVSWRDRPVDSSLCLGGVLFGAGWGLCGMCPGPALTTGASLQGASFLIPMFGARALIDRLGGGSAKKSE